MVVKLIGVWICAWTPYGIMSIWTMFFDSSNLSPTMGLIPFLCCKISGTANVMLYGLRYCKQILCIIVIIKAYKLQLFHFHCGYNHSWYIWNRLPKFQTEVMRMIYPWMPSCLSIYFLVPMDPSSFSAKQGATGLSANAASLRFENSRPRRFSSSKELIEPRSEHSQSYISNHTKPKGKKYHSETSKHRWRGTKCNETSLHR